MNSFTHYGEQRGSSSISDDDSADYYDSSSSRSSASDGDGYYGAAEQPAPSRLYGSDDDNTNSSQFVRGTLIIGIVVAVLTTAYVMLVLINRYCCCCCPTWLKPSEFFLGATELSIQQLQRDGDGGDDDSSNSSNSIIQVDDDDDDLEARRGADNFSPPSLLAIFGASLRLRDERPNYDDRTFHFSSLTLFERKTLLQFILGKSVYIHPKQRQPSPYRQDDNISYANHDHHQDKTQPKTEDTQSDGIVNVKTGEAAKSQVDSSTSSLPTSTDPTNDENSQQDLNQTSSQENVKKHEQNDEDSKIDEPNGQVHEVNDVDMKESIKDDASSTIIVDDEDGVCGICLSEYDPGVPILASPHCQHSFHYDCIIDWLSQANKQSSRFNEVDNHQHYPHTNAIVVGSSLSSSCCCCCPFCRRPMVTLPELTHAAHQIMNPNRLAQLGILPEMNRKSRTTRTPSPTPVPPPSTTTATAASMPASSP